MRKQVKGNGRNDLCRLSGDDECKQTHLNDKRDEKSLQIT